MAGVQDIFQAGSPAMAGTINWGTAGPLLYRRRGRGDGADEGGYIGEPTFTLAGQTYLRTGGNQFNQPELQRYNDQIAFHPVYGYGTPLGLLEKIDPGKSFFGTFGPFLALGALAAVTAPAWLGAAAAASSSGSSAAVPFISTATDVEIAFGAIGGTGLEGVSLVPSIAEGIGLTAGESAVIDAVFPLTATSAPAPAFTGPFSEFFNPGFIDLANSGGPLVSEVPFTFPSLPSLPSSATATTLTTAARALTAAREVGGAVAAFNALEHLGKGPVAQAPAGGVFFGAPGGVVPAGAAFDWTWILMAFGAGLVAWGLSKG